MITRIRYRKSELAALEAGPFIVNSKLVVDVLIYFGGGVELKHWNPKDKVGWIKTHKTRNLNCAKYRVKKELEKLGMVFNNEVRQKRSRKKK